MNWLSKYDRNIQSPFHDRCRRNYRLLLESEHWTRQDMREYQLKRLQQTYSYSKKYVPLYRERYKEYWEHLESWEDFLKLPFLSRQEAAERNPHLHGVNPPFGASPIPGSATSGSSGAKVSIQSTDVGEAMRIATALREFEWMELDPRVPSLFIRSMAKPEDANYEKLRGGMKITTEGRDALMSMYHTKDKFLIDTSAPSDVLAKFIDAAKPEYILCFPSALRAAIPFLNSNHAVRWIKTIGETLDASTRKVFESTFGSTVYDSYSCQELNSIAFSKNPDNYLRIHEENVLVEIVDEGGKEADSGRVLLTSLHPAITPFIRYDIGDLATFADSKTNALRQIAHIDGRVFSQIRNSEGNLVSDSPLFVALHSLEGYVAIQLIQHSIHKFELLIQGSSVDLNKVRRYMEHYLTWAKEIKLTQVENIPKTAGGKLLRYRWLGID